MAEVQVDKYKRIRKLKCYEHVEDMLFAGFPASAVAAYIQGRMNEYRDVKRTSLIQMLKMYRNNVLAEGGFVHSCLPRAFVKAEKKFANKLEELERLEVMFHEAQYRYDVAHGNERLTGTLDPRVDVINKERREIIMRMHKIKMDLGLSGSRDLGTITVSAERIEYIKNKYGDGAAKAFADPVSRGRVLAVLGALNRAGNLRNQDGSPLSLTEHMDLSEDEKAMVVDIEAELEEEEEEEEGDESQEYEDLPSSMKGDFKKGDEMPKGEDLSKPAEDMPYDEQVEALDADMEDLEEEEPPIKPPPEDKVELEPDRGRGLPNMPPGPIKPSIRKNVQKRWSSKTKKKEDK